MSVVTNMLVLPGYTSPECAHRLFIGFRDTGGRMVHFADIADYPGPAELWGGGKLPEVEVWAAALNHADVDEIVAWLKTLPWSAPVAVAVKREYEPAWEWIPVAVPV